MLRARTFAKQKFGVNTETKCVDRRGQKAYFCTRCSPSACGGERVTAMNAGRLKEEVRCLEISSETGEVIALVLVILGVMVAGGQIFVLRNAMNLFTLLGVFLIALGFVVVWTLRHLPHLRRTLSSYEDEWRAQCWTRENFAENIARAIPRSSMTNIPWTIRYAYDLVQQQGLGPYPAEKLFFVTHTANSFEVRRGLSLGLMSLIGHRCLIVTIDGEWYVWSQEVRDRFALLFPIPDDWQPPHDPRLYDFGTDTIPPRT